MSDKETLAELFEISCRGILAAAFQYSNKAPNERQWEILRGMEEITVRDMGEISFETQIDFSLSLVERRKDGQETET